MAQAYLKCEFWKYPHIESRNEYLIGFRAYNKRGLRYSIGKILKDKSPDNAFCIIEESDLVKRINRQKGLAGVAIYSTERDKLLVGIQDIENNQEERFFVPRSDVLFHIPKKILI